MEVTTVPDSPHSNPPPTIYRELERWVRERIMDGALAADEIPSRIELHLKLSIALRGTDGRRDQDRFEHELERQVGQIREQLELEHLGFRPGHVYCHWCRSPVCEHSVPGDPRSVFVGFDPTGRPQWRDFASWIVERRDPRVERLFVERPGPLAVYSSGRDLVKDLLADFGRRGGPYRIVAQIAGGFFLLPRPADEPARELAVTAQLIERRLAGAGDPSYTVNLISRTPEPHHVPTLVAERICPPLTQFVESLRRRERELGQLLENARQRGRRLRVPECRRQGQRLLEQLPGAFEKFLRQKRRRTQHAEDRVRNPDRPTASAHSDALAAALEDLFYDRAEKTFIVRGPRRRIHVFRKDGTHITSIVYSTDTIRDRIRSGRWSAVDADTAAALRAGIGERGQGSGT